MFLYHDLLVVFEQIRSDVFNRYWYPRKSIKKIPISYIIYLVLSMLGNLTLTFDVLTNIDPFSHENISLKSEVSSVIFCYKSENKDVYIFFAV